MKLYTFNVNGFKPFTQYPPWNEFKGDYGRMFEHINADILCVQELKLPRKDLTKQMACPVGYDAFLSFPSTGYGRSGVGIFTRQATLVPLKAEEGLTGANIDLPHSFITPPLAPHERIGGYVTEVDLDLDDNDPSGSDLKQLDLEGRCVVVDLGMFVLINVYCPNETNDERLPFKLNFLRALEARVKQLIAAGREVIVVGDINVVHQPIDHGEGSLASKQEGFWNHPARRWFDSLIAPKGPLTDVVREAHPGREAMFTCWNVKIEARASNYGTRLDYILISKGLVPWVKSANICPEIKGSDHCPVYVELHDELVLPGRSVPTQIGDLLNARSTPNAKTTGPPTAEGERTASAPPRAAAMYYSEFNLRKITSFFTKRSDSSGPPPKPINQTQPKPTPKRPAEPASPLPPPPIPVTPTTAGSSTRPAASDSIDLTTSSPPSPASTLPAVRSTLKSKPPSTSAEPVKKAVKKPKKGQLKLSSFFAPTQPKEPPLPSPVSNTRPKKRAGASSEERSPIKRPRSSTVTDDEHADHLFALALAEDATDIGGSGAVKGEVAAKAWGEIMKPIAKPRCTVHDVECMEKTTSKPGPNKGKRFWMCSLPLGPGHDSGGKANGRLKDEVDVRYKCDFFLWSTQARKNAAGAAARSGATATTK